MNLYGKQIMNILKLLIVVLIGGALVGCNIFDNKVQGEVGQGTASSGSTTPSMSEKIGVSSDLSEYVFDEGTRQSIVINFAKAITKDTTVNWSIDGGASDFNVAAGSVSLKAGDTSFQISLIAMNDGIYEGIENFNLLVDVDENYFSADLVIPLKITEKASPPKLSFASSAETANEGSGTLNVTVNLSQATAQLVKVSLATSGAATIGSDYTMSPPTELVFSPGETSKTIAVTIIDDNVAEGLEDATISLDQVVLGPATIDAANKSHSILIEDNDVAPSPITIAGVTGGTDVTKDFYLTSGNHPVVNWTAPTLNNETGFDVTIYEMNGVTIRCATKSTGIDTTSADFSTCNLVEGASYKISVVGNIAGGGAVAAQNNMVSFTVDTVPPGSFTVLGAMGGNDIVPDGFLAGSLNPTIVWTDSSGEAKYDVKVLNSSGNSFDATNCEVSNIPANSTSYTFESCTLAVNTNYKARVIARSKSGQTTQPADIGFYVTNNQSGYLVLGVTGGTGDTTADENMDDGDAPRVQWQKAFSADAYDIKIRNLANTATVCALPGDGTVGGNISDITFPSLSCNLDLHQQYNVVVKARISGAWVEAANSPYLFRNRVGLYIDGSSGSYINGQTITSCGGAAGDQCNATTPYVASNVISYKKIRVSNNGVLTGAKWTGNTPTNGNGVLTIQTNYLTLDSGGKITMTGKGYTAGLGPGAGSSSGALGNGASHGGLGGLTASGAQGPVYGDVLNPSSMGSGGSNGGSGTVGGSGGGVIDITVNNVLLLNAANVVIESNGGLGTTANCGTAGGDPCSAGGGGGSGGSIKIATEEIRGVSGAKVSVNGAGNNAISASKISKASAGGGGRLALRYNINSFPGLTSLLDASGARTETYAYGTSYSAAGTIFYKANSDISGYLVVAQNDSTIPHVQGVETPIPIGIAFDGIKTINKGTLIIPSTDVYQHFNNYIDFRLVVAGDLQFPATGALKALSIGKDSANPGFLEWRRTDAIQYDQLTIQKNSTLTHSKNSSLATYRLVINTPEVDIFGLIDVSGRGYGMGYGPGRATGKYGASYGGLGGVGTSGSRASVYGNMTSPIDLGSGGSTDSAGSTLLGYGGGSVEINATTVNIVGELGATTKLANVGVIKADGNQGNISGGAGGSIKIVAHQINGKYGTVSANGGDASYGAGSGGRIAILYDKDSEYLNPAAQTIWDTVSTTPYVELTSKGGSGTTSGAAGTMFLKKTANDGADPTDEPADTNGRLWVYNSPRVYDERVTTVFNDSIPLDSISTDTSGTVHIPSGMTVLLPQNSIAYRIVVEGDYINPNPPDLTIASAGYVEWRKASPLIVSGGTFTVSSGGTLTHSKNATTRQYVVNVVADNMVLAGSISAKGKGYALSSGPGAPGGQLWGAAYAGTGSDGGNPRVGSGTPYGTADAKAPFELGSGGYCSNGGGSIRLQVTNTLQFSGANALIDASAPDTLAACVATPSTVGGGASGGSIYISANEIAGTKVVGTTPIINANGGAGYPWCFSCFGAPTNGQSGSAGRIAIVTVKDSVTGLGLLQAIPDKNIMAIGGRGQAGMAGAAGTIYIKREKDSTDTAYTKKESLYLDNDGLTYYDRIETPIPDTTPYDEIVTLGNATLVVTPGQIFNLVPGVLQARLVVAGIFSSENNNLTVKSGGYLQWRRNTPLVLNNLTVESGGVLTHTSNFVDAQYRLQLDLQSLTLNSGSVINVTSKGYQPAAGPGAASSGAGAYGGNSRTALSYGSVNSPSDLGSGGTNGSGGGNIQINVAGLADIAGMIIADGGAAAAAGAGGTIALDVGQLKLSSGYGMHANGGVGTNESGTGGRIAIRYNSYIAGSGGPADVASAAQSSDVMASGGTGTTNVYGAAGTIYYLNKTDVVNTKGSLVIKNSPNPYSEVATTTLPDGGDYDSVYVDPKAAVEVRLGESVKLPLSTLNYRLIMGGQVQTPDGKMTIQSGGVLEVRRGAVVDEFTDLTVNNGGLLTHTSNLDLKKYWLEISANNLTLDSGGVIDVSGKGYAAGYGPSPGCVTYYSYDIWGGGSHGGLGNTGNIASCSRQTYDSVKNPLDFGSGGGNVATLPNTPGGAGGGLAKLNIANDLTLNGVVNADGLQGTCTNLYNCGGSGAGGSINITTKNLKGNNTSSLSANGGRRTSGSYEMSAGGGGRIALAVSTDQSLYSGGLAAVPVQARGGVSTSTYPAAAGTIWRKSPTDINGSLFISNYDTPYVAGTVTELFTNEAFDSVTIGANSSEAAKTGIGVRKGASFDFKSSTLNFPLMALGTPLFTGYTGGHSGDLNIISGGVFEAYGDQPFVFNTVTINSGGTITHGKNTSALTNVLKLTAASVTVKSGGTIDVSEKGYSSGYGPGAGVYAWFKAGGGASFGGLGGEATGTGSKGATYGTADLAVFTVGSGGALGDQATCYGGAGGGGILLNVGTLEVDAGGSIKANGGNGKNSTTTGASCQSGGGGSGGAINIIATQFNTDNTAVGSRIEARGGGIAVEPSPDAYGDGGGGGGGRINISFTSGSVAESDVLNWTVVDGGGSEAGDRNGSTGTFLLNGTAH